MRIQPIVRTIDRTLIPTVLYVTSTLAHSQVINENFRISRSGATSTFGSTVSVDNGLVAVGDWSVNGNVGAAYVFDATTGLLQFEHKDAAILDFFGSAVAMDGGNIAVGVPGDNFTGSMKIYDTVTNDLLAFHAPLGGAEGGIGTTIDMQNGLVVAAAPLDSQNGNRAGAAFLMDVGTNTILHKLVADDGEAQDSIGQEGVAIDNGYVAISAFQDDDQGLNAGAVYLFDVASGNQIAKLYADDAVEAGFFGISISMSNGILAIGARSGGIGNGGRVYLIDVATQTQIGEVSIPGAESTFGDSVSYDDGLIVVSDIGDDEMGNNAGAAYLIEVSSGDVIAKFLPSDGVAGDEFGQVVSIEGDSIAVSSTPTGGGAVYVFSVPSESCPADLTGDGMLNFFDVSAFLSAFAGEDPVADFTGDGIFNFFDVSEFLAMFSAGCP
jgi:hypothetical protein